MRAEHPEAARGARVQIYPSFNPLYYSYFLEGLAALFPRSAISVTARGFPRLGHDCLALRVTDGEKERRIFIHAHDFFSSGLWPETDPHDQIERILLDDGYRESLERNARSYYEEHLTPAAMMRRLLPLARAGP